MKLDHQQRIVQLLVKLKPDGEPYATCMGFLITRSRVLTCAHALRNAVSIQARLIEVDRDRWLEVRPLWPSSNAPSPAAAVKDNAADVSGAPLDVAVLEITPSAVEEILKCRVEPVIAYSSPGDRMQWCSRGAPRATATLDANGGTVSKVIDFGGVLYRPDAGRHHDTQRRRVT